MFEVEAISKRAECNVRILSMNLHLCLAVFARLL
jgi:hypothetical protein